MVIVNSTYGGVARVVLATLFSLPLPLFGRDLGCHGHTFPVVEESLIDCLRSRLEHPARIRPLFPSSSAAQRKLVRPPAVGGLSRATAYLQRLISPATTLQQDITGAKGEIIAKKGTTLNPLDLVSLDQPVLFFDGEDPAQLEWAERQLEGSKWILVAGDPYELEHLCDRPVYFDQGGAITRRFAITAIPARVTQQGDCLLIEEEPSESALGDQEDIG